MPLSQNQISSLLNLVASVESDPIDCDGCFGRIANTTEAKMLRLEIPQALRAIEIHLRQCRFYKNE